MSRPIKFMAWDKKYKRWEDSEIALDINGDIMLHDYIANEYYCSNSHAERFDLYQFTGLLDKDGKEIYEGHKIQWIHADSDYLVSFWRGHWVAVHHPDCASEVEGECKHDNLFHFKTEELEIIGHIAEEVK